jgi:hypothetical protein
MGLAFTLWGLQLQALGELTDCMQIQAQSAKKQGSRRKEEWSVINPNDSKVWRDAVYSGEGRNPTACRKARDSEHVTIFENSLRDSLS